MTLTIGKPEPLRVAPLDKEIKINECVEVYGNDLEFITKAYFPGEEGKDIVVDASNFKRKATGSLYIYSPQPDLPKLSSKTAAAKNILCQRLRCLTRL